MQEHRRRAPRQGNRRRQKRHATGVLACMFILASCLSNRRAGCPVTRLVLGGFFGFALTQLLWLFLAADIARGFEGVLHWPAWGPSPTVRFLAAHGFLVFAVLGGPACAAGLAFPALCDLAALQHGSVANLLGRVMAWHALGAVLGAVGVPSLLLPWCGMSVTLTALSAGLGIVAIAVLRVTSARWSGRYVLWGSGGTLVALALWTGDVTFRVQAAGPQHRAVFHHEDGTGIVEVYEDRQTGHRTLRSSRLRQEGGDRPEDLMVQRLQGALPVLLHPTPRRVLVVGLGTGISLAASLRPEVEHLTCVELSPGVIRAAAWFSHAHGQVLAHPRVALVQQDGRNFLRLTRERYDLIVQDLFFPYRSGVGSLYTLEHYRHLRTRLAPRGRVAQWIALNQIGPDEWRALLRTFTEVFPHTSLWLTGGYLLLYGGAEPLSLTWPAWQQRFDAAAPVAGSQSADVLGTFVAAGEPVRQWASTAPLNTDDNALIEFRTPRAFASLNSVALAVHNLGPLLALHQPVTRLFPALPAALQEPLTRASAAARLVGEGIIARAQGDLEHARGLYERAHALNPVNHQARSFLAGDLAARGRQALLAGQFATAGPLLQRALGLHDDHPQARFDLAVLHMRQQAYGQAVGHLQHLVRAHPALPHVHFNLGVSLYHLGRYAEAVEHFASAVRQEPTSAEAHFNLANSLARAGQYQEAVSWYEQTLSLDPTHRLAQDNLHSVQSWMRSRRHD